MVSGSLGSACFFSIIAALSFLSCRALLFSRFPVFISKRSTVVDFVSSVCLSRANLLFLAFSLFLRSWASVRTFSKGLPFMGNAMRWSLRALATFLSVIARWRAVIRLFFFLGIASESSSLVASESSSSNRRLGFLRLELCRIDGGGLSSSSGTSGMGSSMFIFQIHCNVNLTCFSFPSIWTACVESKRGGPIGYPASVWAT
mmetsp:Transcript_22469/g.42203  ORF Transcript_22469/g.42203 Transcript_22469/m.42203 type:complete len:202 (+) Transcript_22469:374-979(+)